MRALPHNLRAAVRMLLRAPAFTLTAALTLALGLGGITGVFALVYGVVLRPLPFPDAERLVYVDSPVRAEAGGQVWGVSVAAYFHFRAHNRTLRDMGAYALDDMNVSGGAGGPERVAGAYATSSVFRTLGLRPALGRALSPADDAPGAPRSVVLGHDLWTRRYGADRGVVGRTVRVDEHPVRVVGVMPPGVQLVGAQELQPVEVWLPANIDPAAPPVNAHFQRVVGRLQPGVSADSAQADFARMTAGLDEAFPTAYWPGWMEERGFSTRVQLLRERVVGGVSRMLWILLAAVGLVLLIACLNVANLFLVRTEARHREVVIRAAMGATRGDLLRQFVAESVVLALAAGVLGLLLADWGLHLLVATAPESLPRLREVRVDAGTAAFALGTAALAGLLIGLFPVLRFGARTPRAALAEAGRGATSGRERGRIRGALVVAQVALALVLMAAAGLMFQSFRGLRSVDPGFDPRRLMSFEVVLPYRAYPTDSAAAAFHERLVARLRALPGVESAAVAGELPLRDPQLCSALWHEEVAPRPARYYPCIDLNVGTAGYLRTMGITLRKGRALAPEDDAGLGEGAALVSQPLAARLWPGQDPIGQRVGPFAYGPPRHRAYRVVGVTAPVRTQGLERPPTETVYLPLRRLRGQPGWEVPRHAYVLVRTRARDPLAVLPDARAAVAALDPRVPVAAPLRLEDAVRASMARTTVAMLLLGIAAGAALLLAVVGLYGVISYSVGQRRAEIGIRIALGARVEDVAAMVVRQSLVLTAAGVAVGLAASLLVMRVLRSLLYAVSPTDVPTLATVSMLLATVSLVASSLPARRAGRLAPMAVLRAD